jgi:hypothetical protein
MGDQLLSTTELVKSSSSSSSSNNNNNNKRALNLVKSNLREKVLYTDS